MHASPLTRPLGRRGRWAALLLAVLITVGSLSGLGAAPAPGAPLGGVEAIPAVNKASPILFHRRDTLINSTGGSVEAQSLGDAPAGFVQKVREASTSGGDSAEAQSPAGSPAGSVQVVRKAGGLAGGIEGSLRR